MIIDSLTHVTEDGNWFGTGHDASLDRLLRVMDEDGVDRAVVVALAGYIDNAFVSRVCARHADRLIAGASLDPVAHATPAAAAAEARAVLADGEFAVLKLHPRLNGYDPLDPRCLAVLDAVADLPHTVPVWLDTQFRGRVPLAKSPLDTVHTLALRYSQVPFVLLHGLGPELLCLADLVRACPNLTVDLSLAATYYAGTSLDADIGFMLRNRDMRTVAGSDFPEYTMGQAVAALSAAAGKDWAEEKRRRVLGGNLAGLLGLEDGP